VPSRISCTVAVDSTVAAGEAATVDASKAKAGSRDDSQLMLSRVRSGRRLPRSD